MAAVAALAGLLFAYDTGVISGAILFIKAAFRLSTLSEEVVVAGVLAGAVVGAAVSGRLADIWGRRRVLLVAAAIFGGAAIETALSPSVGFLIMGRVASGLAIGTASFTAPLYISEMAPPQYRGRLVSLNQLAITSGIVVA
jgi:SP family galactose:H+ symporter-like MFS transporter